MLNNIPLSLYVHIPWCIKKCPYCDFNSYEKNDLFDEENYVKALLIDLENKYKIYQQNTLTSIFIGGGTPSLFSADSIYKIISYARQLFNVDDIEITLEANPGTFEQEKFNEYKAAGINRLSIGIQSFNNNHLKSLGRIHDGQQAINAVMAAKDAGFKSINLDLMYGLPQQTVKQAVEDLLIATAFGVPHISHYQLTIEENTYFNKHRPVLPENDLIWEMHTRCQETLTYSGYHQYEVSAYATAGKQCLHNLNYWRFGDYIGIGAGAHGKRTEITGNELAGKNIMITRNWNQRQPQAYIKQMLHGEITAGDQYLEQKDIVFEFLLNALRLKAGCELDTFVEHTGQDTASLLRAIANIDPALLYLDENNVRTTDKGFLFLNDILEQLL